MPIDDVVQIALSAKLVGKPLAHRDGECVGPPIGCGRKITDIEFCSWDALTIKEYGLSGWCKDCQDKVFKDPDEEEEEGRCTCDDPPCCEVDIGVGTMTCGDQHRDPCDMHDLEYGDHIGVAELGFSE